MIELSHEHKSAPHGGGGLPIFYHHPPLFSTYDHILDYNVLFFNRISGGKMHKKNRFQMEPAYLVSFH
jgi:hypothetical protein